MGGGRGRAEGGITAVRYVATVDGRDYEVALERAGEVTVDGTEHEVDLRLVDGVSLFSLIIDRGSHELFAERREGRYYVLIDGNRYGVEVEEARLKMLKAMGGTRHEEHGAASVSAPMPGLVVKVLVASGDEVEEGQGLVILEAMKMESEIRSPRSGVVKAVMAQAGQTVSQGDPLAIVDEA